MLSNLNRCNTSHKHSVDATPTVFHWLALNAFSQLTDFTASRLCFSRLQIMAGPSFGKTLSQDYSTSTKSVYKMLTPPPYPTPPSPNHQEVVVVFLIHFPPTPPQSHLMLTYSIKCWYSPSLPSTKRVSIMLLLFYYFICQAQLVGLLFKLVS